MNRIQIPFKGVSTTASYEDGETLSLVNLRSKNGALHPVPPRKIEQELSYNYDIVFVHKNNEYENWIGIESSNHFSSIYWNIKSDNPESIPSEIREKITSVEQIGNTLSLITSESIYYLLFQDGRYIFLGQIPDLPVVSLGAHSQTHAEYYFVNEYGGGRVTPDNFIDATKGLVNKAIDVLVNGGTNNEGGAVGGYGLHLFDACFIRYAFRLFDGTLTKHSPPILSMPMRDIVGKEEEGNFESIKTISYDFDASLRNESKVDVYGHRISLRYDLTSLGNDSHEKWEDIIKSVDIFMSPPLGLSSVENIREDMPTTDSAKVLNYNLIKGLPPEALKTLSNTSNFYFVRSIELGAQELGLDPKTQDTLPSTVSDISKIENLVFQELMTDDNFSNHKHGAELSYVYNNRLHLGNIKTTFFNGFSSEYFKWGGNYNGIEKPNESTGGLVLEVDIYVGSALEKVYSYTSNYFGQSSKLFLSSFISYPDPRAKRMTIYEVDDYGKWIKIFQAPLEVHNLLNLAYYVSDGLIPIIEDDYDFPALNAPNTSKTVTLTEQKIKVSELNNPMVFPNINTYQVGDGTLLAMATNAMNVSDRNYGQHPLYIFTSQGVWTLNVGTESVYSTQTAPAFTEAPATSIVCSTPIGVVFTTKQGLRIINGQSVEFISPQLDQDFSDIKMQLPEEHCKDLVLLLNDKSFKEYLLGIDNIIYNPYEGELIISNKDSEYNYVLNLASQFFYQSTEKIDLQVGNVYPNLLVVGDKQLKDYSSSNQSATHISLITRPISYGTIDIKNLERIILRGLLMNLQPLEDKSPIIMLHSSNDGINYTAIKASSSNPCDRRDYDMGLFGSSKFRQFIFTFAGVVDESSKLHFLDTQIRQEYDNTKMR